MSVAFSAEPVPLSREDNGDIRVGDSRVLIDLVVHAFDDGATPETIVQMYPTLQLPDVYAVITYYLRHRDEVRQYLETREQRAEQTRTMIQSRQPDIQEIRQRLLERRAKRGVPMLRLLSDENFNGEIVRGLVRAQPDLNLVRVQDVDLLGADDPRILTWAAENNRVLVTHDRATIPAFAYDRIRAGEPMPGVFVVDDRAAVGQTIDDILLFALCSEEGEWEGQVLYL